jgi:cobalt-precorrin-5B (C1)-methyltransferase
MKALRWGYSTGACAAAAAKAAVIMLLSREAPAEVEIGLPRGERVSFAVHGVAPDGDQARASVRKSAGDDPDVTDGVDVVASVTWIDGANVVFAAGEGVGIVTKPGLSVPPGEPAINPVPRGMIRSAVREVTGRGVKITISIPGGEVLARKTFNPRLGIKGGLSILGTTGLVRPFSCDAIRCSIECALSVSSASGISAPVLVPGHIGERAARKHFALSDEQIIEVGNEWGFTLDALKEHSRPPFLLVLGHPGKLAKLAENMWDTHSSRSKSAVPIVGGMVFEMLGRHLPDTGTVEGIFAVLPVDERQRVAERLAEKIGGAVTQKLGYGTKVSVVLVNMRGEMLGVWGGLARWK